MHCATELHLQLSELYLFVIITIFISVYVDT